jgi:hypothetical protein
MITRLPQLPTRSSLRMAGGLTLVFFTLATATWGSVRIWQRVMGEDPSHSSSSPMAGREVFYKSLGATPADSDAPKDEAIDNEQFTLEIKVATTRDEAEKTLQLLEGLGITAWYTPLQRHGRVVYRIRRGVFPSQEQARLALQDLKTSQKVDAKIVRLQ